MSSEKSQYIVSTNKRGQNHNNFQINNNAINTIGTHSCIILTVPLGVGFANIYFLF